MLKTIVTVSAFLLLTAIPVLCQLPPDDCSWPATNETPRPSPTPLPNGQMPPAGPGSRLAVKTRTAKDGAGYINYNKGKAIDLAEWFKFTCGLNASLPTVIPSDKPIEGLETQKVTVAGYLLTMRFMRTGDHDIAVELGPSADWNTDHMVIEMSAGPEFCPARKALMDLVRKDGCKDDVCILKTPVKISVTGYLLVGNPPPGVTDLCHVISTRGAKKEDGVVHVRGIWRLQPVLSIKKG